LLGVFSFAAMAPQGEYSLSRYG